MATLYITEFATTQLDLNGQAAQVVEGRPIADDTVTVAGTSDQSAAFNAKTRLIRVHTDVACHILIGENPTATTSDARMAADQTEYFGVKAGDKIAVIEAS